MANEVKRKVPKKIKDGNIEESELAESKPVKVNNNLYKTTRESRKNPDNVVFGAKGRPTKAQLKLIEQYKIHNPKELVKNTIDELIKDELPYIKEAIANLEEYGDPNVYAMLPRELDEFVRTYALIITDYFGKFNRNLQNTTVMVVPETHKKCGKCKKYKHAKNEFYQSKSDTDDGFMHICKDCANALLKEYYRKFKDIRESMILLSQKLDVYVDAPLLNRFVERFDTEEGKEEFKNNKFFGNYLSELHLMMATDEIDDENNMFANSAFGGVPFKCVAESPNAETIYDDKFAEEDDNSDDEFDNSEYRKLCKKWGIDDKHDLKILENRLKELDEQFDLSGLNTQMLVKQLCLEELKLTKLRQANGNTKDSLKAMRELMSDLNLTPKKAKALTSSSFDSLGSAIKVFEKHKPFFTKDESLSDVDGMKKYRDSMVGALARTRQENSEYIKKFEENYKEHSVDILEEIDNDDV